MFTGLVQKTGVWRRVEVDGDSGRLTVEAAFEDGPPVRGESVAVSGACLSLARFDDRMLEFDVLAETLRRTCLGKKKPGDAVNLERSLKVGDRMGGHMVTGHVDGLGVVRALTRAGRDWIVEIACSGDLLSGIVSKGSIAVDGISLTVAECRPDSFAVHIIPLTWSNTSLAEARGGQEVNLETDLIGKYVRRAMQGLPESRVLTMDLLKQAGFD